MRRFLLKNLFLSSLLGLLIASCSPRSGYQFVKVTSVNRTGVPPIIDPRGQASLYKAKIKVFNRHFSGLLLLKQTDSLTAHITFVSEIGMKIFDYEIKDSAFTLTYIFAPLNKPNLLKLLESDMKLLVLHQLYHNPVLLYTKGTARLLAVKENGFTYYYSTDERSSCVHRITKKGKLFTKEKLHYFYSDSLAAGRINLKHKGLVRVKMDFKLLNTHTTQSPDNGH